MPIEYCLSLTGDRDHTQIPQTRDYGARNASEYDGLKQNTVRSIINTYRRLDRVTESQGCHGDLTLQHKHR